MGHGFRCRRGARFGVGLLVLSVVIAFFGELVRRRNFLVWRCLHGVLERVKILESFSNFGFDPGILVVNVLMGNVVVLS